MLLAECEDRQPAHIKKRYRATWVSPLSRLPIHLAHSLEDQRGIAIHALRLARARSGQNRGEPCCLFAVDVPGRGSVVVMTGRIRPIDAGSPFHHIEVELQNALLAEKELGKRDQRELRAFAEDRAAGAEEEVLYKLLRDGRGSAFATAFPIFVSSDLDFVPIKAMMLVETPIFRGDDRVLKIGRDLTERNKFVAFAIRCALNPGLQTALDVHCSGRWIDPPGRQKKEHGEQPERRHTEDKPSNK